jgi:hypothetical protein
LSWPNTLLIYEILTHKTFFANIDFETHLPTSFVSDSLWIGNMNLTSSATKKKRLNRTGDEWMAVRNAKVTNATKSLISERIRWSSSEVIFLNVNDPDHEVRDYAEESVTIRKFFRRLYGMLTDFSDFSC